MLKVLPRAAISILASESFGETLVNLMNFLVVNPSQSTNMLAIRLPIMLPIHDEPSFIALNFNSMNSACELFSDGGTLC